MAHFQFTYNSGLTVFIPQTCVYDEVYYEVGEKLAPNGIPLAMEIECWSELACVGEKYITDNFTVECVE